MRRMIRFGMSVLVASVLVLAACSPTAQRPAAQPQQQATQQPQQPAKAEPIVLKMQSFGGETYPIRVMQERMMKQLEDRSGGRLKISYYPGDSLVRITDVFDALLRGTIDIGATHPSFEPERLGVLSVISSSPWNWTLGGFAKNYRDPKGLLGMAEEYYGKHGIKVLSWMTVGENEIFSRKPIHTMEDLKGTLVATTTATVMGFQALGAEPMVVPVSEYYDQLQRGTMDAATLSTSAYISTALYEVAPYLAISHLYAGNLVLLMTEKVFNSLPADLQQLIETVVLEEEEVFWQGVIGQTNAEIQKLKDMPNVHVYEIPAGEVARWQQIVMPVYDKVMGEKYGSEWQRAMDILAELR